MYRAVLTLLGVPLGGLVGTLGGAMLGSLLDNPQAGHMTRGVWALIGGMALALPGAVGGALAGFVLGRVIDSRRKERAVRDGDPAPVRRIEKKVDPKDVDKK
jgi:hypothetical protein